MAKKMAIFQGDNSKSLTSPIHILPQVSRDISNIGANYRPEDLLKDFTNRVKNNKTRISPKFCRIEFDQNIKCHIAKCVKIATFKDVSNDKIICWFHRFDYN